MNGPEIIGHIDGAPDSTVWAMPKPPSAQPNYDTGTIHMGPPPVPPRPPTAQEKHLVEQLHYLAQKWESSGSKSKSRCARDIRRLLASRGEY